METFWYDQAQGMAGGSKWPWVITVWTGPKPADQRVPDRELTVAALRQAIEMWKTEKRGAYFCGDAAYGRWLQWLRDVDSGKVADVKAGMQGNGWCFDVLVHSRRVAGKWLKAKSSGFDAQAAAQLAVAADHYSAIAEECIKGVRCTWDIAPSPDKAEQWTSGMRQSQITRLESARGHDRAAIAAIQQALAAIEAQAVK